MSDVPRERRLVVDANAASRSWALTPEGERRLLDATPDGWSVHVVRALTSSDGDGPPRPSDEVMQAIVDAEVYFGFGIPQVLFREATSLRWVHSAATGVSSALHEDMVASDVLFTNSAGIHAIPIAEYVVATVLFFLRGLDIVVEQQRGGRWDKQPFVGDASPLREMDTVHALIVGVGGIGGAVGSRLSALGAHCTGVRRRVGLGPPPGFDRVIALDDVDAALGDHDVIVIAAPLTGSTRGLLTADRLDRLPARAIVVNVARGALLDEAALAERIAAGRLRGAALDVFHHEPLAATSPLWQLRQVVVSPHISPVSPGRFWPRQLDLFLENWRRYIQGGPMINVVDKQAGY